MQAEAVKWQTTTTSFWLMLPDYVGHIAICMCSCKFIKTQTSCRFRSPPPPSPYSYASAWHINFTAISRQQLQVIQTSFVALRSVYRVHSHPPLPAALQLWLDFTLFLSRLASSPASCAVPRQAEILLPLFMLSLCNISPAAAVAAAVALGALVFNILQLVKKLLPRCLHLCNGNRSRILIQITRQMDFLSFASLLQFSFRFFQLCLHGYWYLKLCYWLF